MSKVKHVDVFKDSAHEWRWSSYGGNGENIGTSGEGYKNKQHAIDMAVDQHPDAELIVHDREGGQPTLAEDDDID